MNRLHKQRLGIILLVLFSIAMGTSLALYALQQNINLFYSPSQIVAGQAPANHLFRLGGVVEKGSVRQMLNSLETHFVISDGVNKVAVHYTGVLPDLFREGQSVVVEGKLASQRLMIAEQVLAKHDERYMPASIKSMMKRVQS